MENNKANADILNDLVQINNDRIAGYEKALKELRQEDDDLRPLFLEMIAQSHRLKSALVQEIQVNGEDASQGTTTYGKIYRGWMDLKAIFTGHDKETVLNNCEFGEDAAQKAYQMALDEDTLSANLRSLISYQKFELKGSHDEIKALRDQVAQH
ncbi:PA2169 family four-helix-bundle protein [Pedobacter sp. JY14-1]|uniref:ferritin-like domain-containing protein n=1 Tax=Pedobacter sp. JY14-1 TaxID=3034151 RepID=UPI0023E1278F|nr:PA2169 family four-helix-bundle protein [Pedobacter sp. JY14-1]